MGLHSVVASLATRMSDRSVTDMVHHLRGVVKKFHKGLISLCPPCDSEPRNHLGFSNGIYRGDTPRARSIRVIPQLT